jgi:PDZ domain
LSDTVACNQAEVPAAAAASDDREDESMKLKSLGLCASMIFVCLIGFATSLVPLLVLTEPFWGVDGFMDRGFLDAKETTGVLLNAIAADSTAAKVGLQNNDRVIAVNGRRVTFGNFRQLLHGVKAGEHVALQVERDGKELQIECEGESPELEAVLYLDWQFISAPVSLVVLLLLIATQPLKPPLWRSIVVVVAGLTVLTVTVAIECTQYAPWTPVWRVRSMSHSPSRIAHYSLAIVMMLAGLALAFLGTFGVRADLIRRAGERAEKPQDSHRE